jgi:hypothetical protein
MYFSVMRKFYSIGVDLLPPLARAPRAVWLPGRPPRANHAR